MLKYTRRLGAPLFVVADLRSRCVHRAIPRRGRTATALGADTTLNRDLALANRDTTAQPQLKDVPANQPVTAAPTRRAHEPSVRRRAPARTRRRHESRHESAGVRRSAAPSPDQ